jgi:two-component system sensor histidine kinase KdpD
VAAQTSSRRTNPPSAFFQGLAFGLASIAAIVALFTQIVHANATTAGFVLLLVVLTVATAKGLAAATVVSVAAMLSFNFFFLPPIGRFTIADPENWVALFTFLATALVASHLSNQAQQQAIEARNSQRETEQLYALSRTILLTESNRSIGLQAAQSIAQIFELPAAALLNARSGEVHRGGPSDLTPVVLDQLESALKEVARQGQLQRIRDIEVRPISLGGQPIGALALQGMNASDGAVQSIVNLVAIALERVRTQETASRAEAAQQSEEFKSTLLDAIAHEFKTPLTSIKAAATGLGMAEAALPAHQRELIAIINEEADRLSHLVTEAVRMAGIDARKTAPQKSSVDIPELFEEARRAFDGRGADRIALAAKPALRAWADRELTLLALRQLIDNALKYSGASSQVLLSADTDHAAVIMRVSDQGPGIPARDAERVFEKFYRRTPAQQIPGTGLGLHIAREIARIHGGDLRLDQRSPSGATFCLSLPAAEAPLP